MFVTDDSVVYSTSGLAAAARCEYALLNDANSANCATSNHRRPGDTARHCQPRPATPAGLVDLGAFVALPSERGSIAARSKRPPPKPCLPLIKVYAMSREDRRTFRGIHRYRQCPATTSMIYGCNIREARSWIVLRAFHAPGALKS